MNKVKLAHVRALRKNMTEAENHLWYHLRSKRLNGYKFRRQHLIYPYVVDFICLDRRLIIECDGSQHLEQQKYDNKRSVFLENKGFRLIRFFNDIVLNDIELVLDIILEALELSINNTSSSP